MNQATFPSSVPRAFTLPPDDLILALVRAGWKQERIAHASGLTQASISRIRSGKHKDPRHSAVAALQRLVLTLDDFEVEQ